jgi:putative membrane protein
VDASWHAHVLQLHAATPYYTDALGPKLFLVPLVIGVAYCATGYLAWALATVLFGEVRRGSSALTTVGVPVVASFIMVAWDLCMDPPNSTIQRWWIWEQGGATSAYR